MLSWLFKKRGAAAVSPAAPAPGPAARPGPKQRLPGRPDPAGAALPPGRPALSPEVDWAARLAAAQGDDAALLGVAQSASQLAVKLAAVASLSGEGVLRQAEREFRTHDRKVHRLAKQRLEAAVAQREARAQAQVLLAQAQALADDPQLPVNRVGALDRDWAALPAPLLEAGQRVAFEALRARLGVTLRAQAEALQSSQRWTAEAQRCLQQGPGDLRAVAEQGSRADALALGDALAALRQSRPEGPATVALDAALAKAQQAAAWLQGQLERLEAPGPEAAEPVVSSLPGALALQAEGGPWLETGVEDAAAETGPGAGPSVEPEPVPAPGVEPPGLEPALARLLEQRLQARARASQPAAAGSAPGVAEADSRPKTKTKTNPSLKAKPATRSEPAAATPEQCQPVEALLLQAETALAEGQLGLLQQRLQALDPLLARKPIAWPEALRARQQALWAERGRLKDWQQWGGDRVRDDLVAEAQALALQVQPGADPAAAAGVQAARAHPAEPSAEAAAEAVPQAAGAKEAPEASPAADGVGAAAAVPAAGTARAAEAVPSAGASDGRATVDAAEAMQAAPAADAADAADATEATEATERADGPEAASPPAPATGARRPPAPRPSPKLNLKALADSIQSLRQRWKDIDRQGAAASAEQWRAFDAALHTAHGPLAAQHAALQAARRENQAAREALLATLEALPAPGAAGAEADPDASARTLVDPLSASLSASVSAPLAASLTAPPAGPDPAPPVPDAALDWRDLQHRLTAFQAAWRQLGPLEHTAPAASREALQQRLQRAVARLEEPLRARRDRAVAERERLIARAQACLPAGADRPPADAARQVRELQAEWQEHARGLPLPRGIENALWMRFKAATDAVFVQREAAFAARDAERAAHLTAAEGLVQRLVAAGTALPLADIERTLAEVDRAWRQGGELPRGTVDALEARYRAARAAAVQRQADGQRLEWQAQCEALAARLRQCEAREDAAGRVPADPEARPVVDAAPAADAAPRLPKAWEQPLAQRAARPADAGPGPLPAAPVDEWLLRLETALNLPTAPEWQAARQQLKLRALKDSLEGRSPPPQARPEEALRAALLQSGLSPAQRARLQALVAALRLAPPGTLAR